MKKFLLSLICLFAVIPFVQADTISSNFTDKNLTVGTGELTWTASPAAGSFENSGSNRGVAWSKPGTLTLTSGSELPANATISQIDVVCSSNVASAYTLSAEVGGAAFGTAVTLAKENNVTQTFEGSAVGSIQLKAVGTSSAKSIWIKSITVTYTTGGGPVVQTVATPEISPASCNFSEDFDATITCTTDGATILYSLDGSEPSIVYNGPVSIDAGASVTLKAKATKADWNDSSVAEAVYTYVEPAPEGAKYQLVELSEITASDIVVIYDGNSERAMSNNNGTGAAPSAVAVGHNEAQTELVYTDVTDALKWNIVLTDDGYIIYPNGTTDTWLYCTAANNGVRVGVNNANTFTTDTNSGRVYLKHIGTSRYLGVYNNQDWRCYTSMGGNIASQNTKFYRYIASAGAQVETPAISPNGGSDLTEAQTVTLSCETDGASIYYTLDGSTPTAESTLYSAPFQVSETTTVKAIGIKEGLTNSSVASATFSFRVAASSIADLYTKTGLDGSTQIYVNFPLTVTAPTKGKNTFVQDGQGGYSLIYFNNNTVYAAGDVIPAGWYAKATTYQGLNEIVPLEATPAASGSATVDYPVTAVSAITVENQCKPATVNDVVIADTPTSNTITATVGGTTFSIYNISSTAYGDIEPGGYNVKGVITLYNGAPQLNVFEFEAIPVPDVYILGNINENNNAWAPNVGYQMVYDAGGAMYTATIHAPAAGASFSFATALGTSSDWNTLNGRDVRWGHGGTDYTLTAEDMQGQNAIACSKYDYTTGSYVIPEGEYNLILSFDGDGLNAYLFVEKVEAPKDVYILGTVNTTAMNWVPYEGVLMTRDEDTGLYSAEVYAEVGDRINFAHFLGSTWAEVNVPGNRFSVPNQNYMVNDSSRGIQMAYSSTDPYSFEFGTQGKWEVVVNLDNEGEMTADFNKLEFEAPTFSETSKEFHAAFDLTITGPEGSTITYVLNDDLDNAVTTQSNVAVVNIPAEDTSVLAWATLYGVDSESAEENYIYSASTGTTYTKLASGAEIKAGKYLIVYEVPAASGSSLLDASTTSVLAFNGSLADIDSDTKLDHTNNYVSLNAANGSVTTEDDIYFTIAPRTNGEGYSIQSASGKYIGVTSYSNALATSLSDNYVNYIGVGENGAEIRNDFTSGSMYLKFNDASNQMRFRYYKDSTTSGIRNIELYYSDTTGVDKVAASDSEVVSTAYYNLQGVRLAAPAQGQIAIRVSTLANGQIRASKVVVR